MIVLVDETGFFLWLGRDDSGTDQSTPVFEALVDGGVWDLATAWDLGVTNRTGLKPESPNQGQCFYFALNCEPHFAIYGVFDGHGRAGHVLSNFVKNTLPKVIMRDARFKDYFFSDGPDQLQEVMRDAFEHVQSLILTADQMG